MPEPALPANLPNPPSEPTPLARLPARARRRLAALSLVGVLMVALPLGQVLRYQNNEVQLLLLQRAGLDPMARAVDVQRSLLLHRDVTARVLHGHNALEDERRVRQGEVDDHVAALALALVSGGWERAMRESDALREDWSLLARRVLERSLNASQSDQAHRLLVEQALQVMDLLVAAHGSADPAVLQALAMARSMPLYSMASLPQAELPSGGLGDQAQAALQALQVAQVRSRHQRFAALMQTAAARLAARTNDLQQARTALLAAMAVLALVAVALLRPLLRGPGRGPRRRAEATTLETEAVPLSAPAPPPAPRADRQLTGQLMQRLRATEEAAPARIDPTGTVEPLPSLPPP